MKTLLYDTLMTLGYPVYLLGSIAENEPYPQSFIMFMTVDSPDNSHYDNGARSWAWRFQVTFYSSDPSLVNREPSVIRDTLKAAGFIPDGKGRDLISDDPAYTSWTQDFFKIETEV